MKETLMGKHPLTWGMGNKILRILMIPLHLIFFVLAAILYLLHAKKTANYILGPYGFSNDLPHGLPSGLKWPK